MLYIGKLSRRAVLHGCGALLFGAPLLAACGSTGLATQGPGSTTAATSAASSGSIASAGSGATSAASASASATSSAAVKGTAGKTTVQYWHMWGHPWQEVIEGKIVPMFNQGSTAVDVQPTLVVSDKNGSPEEKVIAAIAGGTPPDIMTEWNAVLATWADKQVITALEPLLTPAEQAPFREWFWPIALKIGMYQGHQYGAPSTMNSWALVWNKQLFQQTGLDPEQPPQDQATLDSYAEKLYKAGSDGNYTQIGFMPGNIWQWGDVFGGDFYDEQNDKITITNDKIVNALTWMVGYQKQYPLAKRDNLNKVNGASAAGKIWSMLTNTVGMNVDGQWRVLDAARDVGKGFNYGVAPMPPTPDGRKSASWVNGNYQVIFKAAKQQRAAMDFLKFWSGFGTPTQMATICTFGGWIPPSPKVVPEQPFQEYLKTYPAFKVWTDIYQSDNTRITPVLGIQQDFSKFVGGAESDAAQLKLEPKAALDKAQQLTEAKYQEYKSSAGK